MKTILLLFSLFTSTSFAQTYVGTFITVRGDVKILRSPGPTSQGPYAMVDGVKYEYETAKIGKKVAGGEMVNSGANGKAKIAFPNGDHFIVGNGTSMVMPEIQQKADGKTPTLNLLYGRVRSLISRSGPSEKMKVKTPGAVAGVRGTDFFTRVNPTIGTQLTVLRGEVVMKSDSDPKNVVSVKKGDLLELKASTKKLEKPVRVPKEELILLQSETTIKPTKDEFASLPAEEKEEIKKLNTETKEAILKDIQKDDLELFKNLAMKKNISAEEINTAVVADIFTNAPSDETRKKPTLEEVDGIGKDVYEKYFKEKKK